MSNEWQRSIVTLTAAIVTAMILFALYWARSIFIPIALAIFLVFVLSPIAAWLQRRGLGRGPVVGIIMTGLLLVTVGTTLIIMQQLTGLANTLPDRSEAIKAKLVAAKTWVVGDGDSRFGAMMDDLKLIVEPPQDPNAQRVVLEPDSSWVTQANSFAGPVGDLLGQAAFTFVLTVFMLLKKEDLRNRMIRLIGYGMITTTTKAVDDASRRISRYLLSQLLLNTAFGLICAAGLFALGVHYAILWGFIATVMRYVPYIGTWIGVIPPALYSLATSEGWMGGWGQPLGVLVLFLGLEAICNNAIEPWLYGRSMGISEVAQLVSAGIWLFLWGPIGMILSGPFTVCLFVLGRHVRRFQFLEIMLGDQPVLEPKIAFYQRLAARDPDEASTIAFKRAKETSPDAVFDDVFVPTLYYARRDHIDGLIDKDDLQFIHRSIAEIADDVEGLLPLAKAAAQTERVRLLLVAAKDASDAAAVELLARMFDETRWEVQVAGHDTLAAELLERIEEFDPAIVLIGAMAPGGLTHSRYLATRIRKRFPELKVLFGRWKVEDEGDGDLAKSLTDSVDGIDYTMTETRNRIREWYSIYATGEQNVDPGEKVVVVGTVVAS